MTRRFAVAAVVCGVFVSLLLLMSATGAFAASIGAVNITPANATSNSLYTLTFTWKADTAEGSPPWWDEGTLRLGLNDGIGWAYYDLPEPPAVDPDSKLVITAVASDGTVTFRLRMSSGLHMSPAYPDVPFDSSIYYIGDGPMTGFVAKGSAYGAANNLSTRLACSYTTDKVNAVTADGNAVTVHDSHPGTARIYWLGNTISGYNGTDWDRDWLYSLNQYGDLLTLDPLQTKRWNGLSPDDAENPDDGTTSTVYTFRVLYQNKDNMPPVPYIRDRQYFYFNRRWDNEVNTGVMLYIWNPNPNPDYLDQPHYYVYPMQKVGSSTDYAAGVMYEYVYYPTAGDANNGWNPGWNHAFVSLPLGEYDYFYGCTDDYVREPANTIPEIPYWLDMYPWFPGDPNEWNPEPLIFGPRQPQDVWSVDNTYDLNVYIDRVTYRPGVVSEARQYSVPDFWLPYSEKASEHPVVSLGLYGPRGDNHEWFHGHLPWRGTLRPYRRAVNPTNGWNTAGAASDTRLYFQIRYAQLDGIKPEDLAGGEISVWINNSNDDSTTYTKYALEQVVDPNYPYEEDITCQDPYADPGILYRTATPITLKTGPHTYYFTASDGRKFARFPVNGTTGPHYIRGPYVNRKSTLGRIENGVWIDPKVDPPVGTAGDNYRFSVTYTDPDNQRPYSAHLIVKYGDGIDEFDTVTMTKLNPSDNTYSDGCVYIFDSANLAHKLQPGVRKYYMEFVDDWGAPSDPNDRIKGETCWTKGAPEWIEGPFISTNHRPTLNDGVVESPDGTMNGATVWNYKVVYKDQDNHKPAYINVYIGKHVTDPIGGESYIEWDSGHPMTEADAGDIVYTDGKEYRYTTTLQGAEIPNSYYYCFIASDGIDVAQFREADPQSRSAHAMWWTDNEVEGEPGRPGVRVEPLDSPTNTVFVMPQSPLVEIRGDNEIIQGLYHYPIVYTDTGLDLVYSPVPEDSEYYVDFVNGVIQLLNYHRAEDPNHFALDGQEITSEYIDVQFLYGVPGPTTVGANTPPMLESGSVSPNPGTSADTYTFSVIYKDQDGQWGQAPVFIRVKVDGVEHAMQSTTIGQPNFKTGARYTATMTLRPGVHRYYFEASDGAGYAIYDNVGNRSSVTPIIGFDPITGPYVNDRPTLTNPTITPNPAGGSISVSQPVTYGVTYNDANNEAPQPGYPVVYISSSTLNNVISETRLTETDYVGTVTGVGKITITDSSQNWTVDLFKGVPVQFTSGTAQGTAYVVQTNTKDTLTLVASDLVNQDRIMVGDTFSIGRLVLLKSDPTDNDYTDGAAYLFNVPGLGEGPHSAHFKSVTTEVIGESLTRDSTVRTQPEISGPTVAGGAPAGNRAPVLASGGVTPTSGTSSTEFKWNITYSDLDGDPATLHDNVLGYVQLVLDGTPIDMVPPAQPDWVGGALMSYPDPAQPGMTLNGGVHQYYFIASDGYQFVRFPSGVQTFSIQVNQKPELTEPSVTPTEGNWGRTYVYKVTYTDVNNEAPYGEVDGVPHLRIDDVNIDLDADLEEPVSHDGLPYSEGRTFTYVLKRNYFLGKEGPHTFYFRASDGSEYADNTETITAPRIHLNEAPNLSGGTVVPTQGFDADPYTYKVTWTDPNGDEPEYVYVEIDGGGTPETTLLMSKTNPEAVDYDLGVEYRVVKNGLPVLPAGQEHTYRFRASDWLEEVTTDTYTGPQVNERPGVSVTVSTNPVSPAATQPTTVSGKVTPAISGNVTIRYTKPDSTVVNTSVAVNALTGNYSTGATPWRPDVPGNWKVQTLFPGNLEFRASASPEITVVVQDRPAITLTLQADAQCVLGEALTLSGQMSPVRSKPVSVSVRRLGSLVTYPALTLQPNQAGAFSTTWTPPVTGNWEFQASITASTDENDPYAAATSPVVPVEVVGPSLIANGMDMISLPLSPTSGFPDSVLGPAHDYGVAKWSPARSDYRIYSWLPGGRQDLDFPMIAPGQGYWIKTSKNQANEYVDKLIAPEGSIVTVSEYPIALSASGGGWNMIGCPYTVEVDWSTLKVRNGSQTDTLVGAAAKGWIREYAWCYDKASGNYKLIDANKPGAQRTIRPWQGAWVRALVDCQLIIPKPVVQAAGALNVHSNAVRAASTAPAPLWQVGLIARNGELADENGFFGISGSAALRIEKPACIECYVDVAFADGIGGRYASDMKARTDKTGEWIFDVTTDVAGCVELTWPGLEIVPAQVVLTLTDETDGVSVEMVPGASYKFDAGAGATARRFRITAKAN